MANYTIVPEHEFAYELSLIQSDLIRGLVVKALNNVPDYFWFVPSSASGKYHMTESLGMGGLIRHTKAVVRALHMFLGNPMVGDLYEDSEKDRLYGAGILHDSLKQGVEGTHTVHEHPLLVRHLLDGGDGLSEEENVQWNLINNLISTHMGVWNTHKDSDIELPLPATKAQKLLHLSDYVASQPNFHIDVFDRVPQSNYNSGEPELATTGQLKYIAILDDRCKKEGIKNPFGDVEVYRKIDGVDTLILTKREAGGIIGDLKTILGIGSK